MSGDPRVTVLMPVRNGSRFLNQAINSILAQTYKDFEFLIIDDGSTDNSVAIIQSHSDKRIRLKRQPHRGLAQTLYDGLLISRGDIIVRADADDISHPDRIEMQVNCLDDRPDIGFCRTRLLWINADGSNVASSPELRDTHVAARWQFLWKNIGSHSSAAFRRSVTIESGINYRPALNGVEDFDLWSRLIRLTGFFVIDEYLVQYRIHDSSVMNSIHTERLRTLFANVVRDNFDAIGINLSSSEAEAVAVLSGQTLDDAASFSYKPLVGRLHVIAEHARHVLVTKGYPIPRRSCALHYVSWSRYLIQTTRRYALFLFMKGIILSPTLLLTHSAMSMIGHFIFLDYMVKQCCVKVKTLWT